LNTEVAAMARKITAETAAVNEIEPKDFAEKDKEGLTVIKPQTVKANFKSTFGVVHLQHKLFGSWATFVVNPSPRNFFGVGRASVKQACATVSTASPSPHSISIRDV
jgi:hypothetical protein